MIPYSRIYLLPWLDLYTFNYIVLYDSQPKPSLAVAFICIPDRNYLIYGRKPFNSIYRRVSFLIPNRQTTILEPADPNTLRVRGPLDLWQYNRLYGLGYIPVEPIDIHDDMPTTQWYSHVYEYWTIYQPIGGIPTSTNTGRYASYLAAFLRP